LSTNIDPHLLNPLFRSLRCCLNVLSSVTKKSQCGKERRRLDHSSWRPSSSQMRNLFLEGGQKTKQLERKAQLAKPQEAPLTSSTSPGSNTQYRMTTKPHNKSNPDNESKYDTPCFGGYFKPPLSN